MNILIADDHAVVRRGLKDILSEAHPGAAFFEAAHGDEVLKCLASHPVSLVVLDINMPGRSGLDVLEDIKRSAPRLPVIILSYQPQEQFAVRCLRAGASAYLNKDSAVEELAKASAKVLAGGRYISPQLAESLVLGLEQSEEKPPHEQLSNREHEVMRMIATGITLTDIADQLHVSVKTVSTYRARILEKMGMQSNAELTRYALVHKLID